MATILVRNLDEQTVQRLKERAARNKRSLQKEVHEILERAALITVIDSQALAARIREKLSGRKHSDSAALIREDRRR